MRSWKRSSSLPTLTYRPDSSHSAPGSTTGMDTSCPSIASISSRMICSSLRVTRRKGGYWEKIPFAMPFMYPPRTISAWLSMTQPAGRSRKRSPTNLSSFIFGSSFVFGRAGRFPHTAKNAPGRLVNSRLRANRMSVVPPEFGKYPALRRTRRKTPDAFPG